MDAARPGLRPAAHLSRVEALARSSRSGWIRVPAGQVHVGLVPRQRQGVGRHRLMPPGAEASGHLPDESCPSAVSCPLPRVSRPPARPPPATGRIRPAPAPGTADPRQLALPPPEAADSEEGIGTLEQAARRPRIVAPRRIVALPVVRQCQRDEIKQRAQLQVLHLMDEGPAQVYGSGCGTSPPCRTPRGELVLT